MAPFDDLPIPHVDPVTRVGSVQRGQRVRAVQLPPGVVPPVGQRLLAAWQRRKGQRRTEDEPEEPVEEAPPFLEVDPPETYGEHGELLHPHEAAASEGARLDLEA